MRGPIDSRRKRYWPPARGYIAASSPYASAPSSVITPASTQARIIQSGEGRSRAIPADTMKMPDPIIDPATSIVASVRVIALTNPVSDRGVASVGTAELLMQVRKKREGVGGGCRRRFRDNPAKCRSEVEGLLERCPLALL